MPRPSHISHKQIAEAFIRELEAFKHGGYRFSESGRKLFEGTQREAFDAYLDGLKAKHREGYYEIPTGVGKTALFIAIIGCYLRATENSPDAPRVLIHEPTTDLVIQTAQSFADFMPDIARRIEADDDQGREIDWANSQIDVHYTGRRGAGNKPNVLITTYQGQAADQRKQPERRIHNPADFGLVIHDEAHFLTGEKYGPAAVDKFQGAIQLGVTATPEYSKDKTVANKLGYRYYHLPLNTAIERGDLCHVRPIVLMTHLRGKDAINLEMAKQFFEQQRGQPLSKKQLEQLLNQEARNQAIIKAYLNGSHPDTDERFLGQTGMIFAGGITHCNDLILHTERVLNQPAYRNIKQWLREEGVALIAPIHSDIPKEGVEIDFGGQRRKCTKDEIKELHRRGKILLIISDQELKLGSDFPMDSFIVDAVDRFSVPDATQRMGRGFRVDRGDERRNLPPNPDKSCVAINVIDETTHEMYQGTPHHPIHANEILQGAEHRPPGRRVGALTRYRNLPPEVSEGLEMLGFEVITRAEAMRNIVRQFKEQQRPTLPRKTDEWWSGTDIRTRGGGWGGQSAEAIAGLKKAFESGRGEKQPDGCVILDYGGHPIRAQRMLTSTMQTVCFFGDDILRAGIVRGLSNSERTESWLNIRNVMEESGGRKAKTLTAVRSLKEMFESGEGETQPDGSTELTFDGHRFRVQRIGKRDAVSVLRDDLIAAGLIADGQYPAKDDAWWSLSDLIRKVGGQSAVLKRLAERFEAGEGRPLGDGIAVVSDQGVSVRTRKMQARKGPAVCFLGEDLVAAGLVQAESLPKKTDAWLTKDEVRFAKGGNRAQRTTIVTQLLHAFETGAGTRQPDGTTIVNHAGVEIHMQRMLSRSRQAVCFRKDDLLHAGLIPDDDREIPRSKPPLKTDVTPGSDHLKRTGRSRSGPEE